MPKFLSLMCGLLFTVSAATAQTTEAPIIRYADLRHPVLGPAGMVSSQNALATEVGAQLLADGGNAVDAAVAVGFANFLDPGRLAHYHGVELTIHDIETYIGILIGAVTFSGSVIAFGKLSGKMSGNPLILPARHWLNLILLLVVIYYGYAFVVESAAGGGTLPLIVMTAVALLFGIHMVMAIGGADMPVVVSMLNSYSGWAASATGFMLGNDLLIVTGALVGSSGAILSYIMCRAMNRSIWNVVFGGFGRVAEQRLHVGVLEILDMTRDVSQVLADPLGHFQILADIEIGRLGPALGHVDQGAVGGLLVRLVALTERLHLVQDELQAFLRVQHARTPADQTRPDPSGIPVNTWFMRGSRR